MNPANHFFSLAPEASSGLLFNPEPTHLQCLQAAAWNTPQLRVLLYQLMAALAFSGVIEPALLYTARYKMENQRDAEKVIAAVLLSFGAFDILHLTSVIVVVGTELSIPTAMGTDWSNVDLYAGINIWVPVAWLVLRTLWLLGVGREVPPRVKRD